MKKTAFLSSVALLVFLTACTPAAKKERTISISGAFALYPLVVQWAEQYKMENPEVRFNISAGGAGKGMADALSGTVDLGMFSRAIAQEEIDKGVWWVGLTIDAVLPTISSNNPLIGKIRSRGLSREEMVAIFIDGTVTNWNQLPGIEDDVPMEVYTRSDACGAAGTWALYLGGKQENLKGIGIYGDPGLADAVINDAAGIGFNNTIFVYDINTGLKRPGIEVAPIDLDGSGMIEPGEDFYGTFDGILDAIAAGDYPSPPARELYFVANGKPAKKATLEFIEWALTKGQDYVKSAGYVPIAQEKIDAYLDKLK
jgi:phosphate transport system substrate-binding protein